MTDVRPTRSTGPTGPTRSTRAAMRAAGGVVGRLGPGGTAVAIAGFAVNLFGFAVPLLGARTLAAGDLGALATVLALAAIASVAGQGLQAAVAVRVARAGALSNAGRATLGAAVFTAGCLLLATPVIMVALHLSPALTLLVTATVVPVVIGSRWLGELQGAQRFLALATAMGLLAVARYGGIIVGLAAGTGVTASVALGAAVGWVSLPVLALLARPRSGGSRVAAEGGESTRLHARDVAAACAATLAMLAVSYADLIFARHLLSPAESGAYAVGSVLTKGALWAPQVVTVLALPRLARGSRLTLRLALAAVGACGAALVLASAVAGGLAMGLAGGSDYTRLGGYAAGFATVGALYAVVFVLVNAEIAARVRWPALPLWVALAGFATVALLLEPPTLGRILTASVVTAVVTTASMAIMAIRTRPTLDR